MTTVRVTGDSHPHGSIHTSMDLHSERKKKMKASPAAPLGVEGSRGWRKQKHRARGKWREVRRTGDLYQREWREGGVTLGFLRSPACTRVPNFWSSRSLASACTRRNGGEMLSGDAGRGLGFARREPGWGGRPGNQSAVGCTPQAWPAHIQGTKRVHSS
jgi:hypothetical protein